MKPLPHSGSRVPRCIRPRRVRPRRVLRRRRIRSVSRLRFTTAATILAALTWTSPWPAWSADPPAGALLWQSLQRAGHPDSRTVGHLRKLERQLVTGSGALTVPRLLEQLPQLSFPSAARETPYVQLAAAFNAAAYLGQRRKASSAFAPESEPPPHALHPYLVDRLICRAWPVGSKLREVCRIVALLHDVIEDKTVITARDPKQLSTSLRLVAPDVLHSREPEERAVEASALARDRLNTLFAGLSGRIPGGRGIGDLVLLASHPLIPRDHPFEFSPGDGQNGGLKAMRKAALAVAQVLRQPEVGPLVATIKIADATETLDPRHMLLDFERRPDGLTIVDKPGWRQRLDRVAWQLARRRYLVDELARQFDLPRAQTADFEAA
jgi:hypothetical protein